MQNAMYSVVVGVSLVVFMMVVAVLLHIFSKKNPGFILRREQLFVSIYIFFTLLTTFICFSSSVGWIIFVPLFPWSLIGLLGFLWPGMFWYFLYILPIFYLINILLIYKFSKKSSETSQKSTHIKALGFLMGGGYFLWAIEFFLLQLNCAELGCLPLHVFLGYPYLLLRSLIQYNPVRDTNILAFIQIIITCLIFYTAGYLIEK